MPDGNISTYDPAAQKQIAMAYLAGQTRRRNAATPIDVDRAIADLATKPSVVDFIVKRDNIAAPALNEEPDASMSSVIDGMVDDSTATVPAPVPVERTELPPVTTSSAPAAKGAPEVATGRKVAALDDNNAPTQNGAVVAQPVASAVKDRMGGVDQRSAATPTDNGSWIDAMLAAAVLPAVASTSPVKDRMGNIVAGPGSENALPAPAEQKLLTGPSADAPAAIEDKTPPKVGDNTAKKQLEKPRYRVKSRMKGDGEDIKRVLRYAR